MSTMSITEFNNRLRAVRPGDPFILNGQFNIVSRCSNIGNFISIFTQFPLPSPKRGGKSPLEYSFDIQIPNENSIWQYALHLPYGAEFFPRFSCSADDILTINF